MISIRFGCQSARLKSCSIQSILDHSVTFGSVQMARKLFLKKGNEDPLGFLLFKYQESEGGLLNGPSTLNKLKLRALEAKLPGDDDYVTIPFDDTSDKLSLVRFQANTAESALPVKGEGEMPRQLATHVQCLNLSASTLMLDGFERKQEPGINCSVGGEQPWCRI